MKTWDTKLPEDYTGPCYVMRMCINDGTENGHSHPTLIFYRKTAATDMVTVLGKVVVVPGFQTVTVDYYEDVDVIEEVDEE